MRIVLHQVGPCKLWSTPFGLLPVPFVFHSLVDSFVDFPCIACWDDTSFIWALYFLFYHSKESYNPHFCPALGMSLVVRIFSIIDLSRCLSFVCFNEDCIWDFIRRRLLFCSLCIVCSISLSLSLFMALLFMLCSYFKAFFTCLAIFLRSHFGIQRCFLGLGIGLRSSSFVFIGFLICSLSSVWIVLSSPLHPWLFFFASDILLVLIWFFV